MQTLTVEFSIRDIVHPDPAKVLLELYGSMSLAGEVIAVTDNGEEPRSFLTIRVPGLAEPVIVPAPSTRPHDQERGTEHAGDLLISTHGVYLKANPPAPE